MKNKKLFGCSTSGVLYLPNGLPFLWLPKKLAYKLHNLLNNQQPHH